VGEMVAVLFATLCKLVAMPCNCSIIDSKKTEEEFFYKVLEFYFN